MTLWNWIRCHLFGDHDWTSRAAQGEKPTQAELDAGLTGFYSYAVMFCARCGHVSHLSRP